VFKLPTDPLTPIIMIGAGAEVSPFRRIHQIASTFYRSSKPVGKMPLFFVCCDEGSDFLYKEEWGKWKEKLGDEV
jgi:sulfite reductase alpha subunit-like flavoprotein